MKLAISLGPSNAHPVFGHVTCQRDTLWKEVEASRVGGLMRMLERAHELVNTLAPTGRRAVLVFGSHRKLYADFTTDRARLGPLIDRAILFENRPTFEPSEGLSLAAHFKLAAGQRAATVEEALLPVGRAPQPLPGPKSLVLLAWGMGRLDRTHVVVDHHYDEARQAFASARVAAFSLDVTDANNHPLEAGLRSIATATGGFYEQTNQSAGLAMTRLQGALAGH